MKADLLFYALLGLANASALTPRDTKDNKGAAKDAAKGTTRYPDPYDDEYEDGYDSGYDPKYNAQYSPGPKYGSAPKYDPKYPAPKYQDPKYDPGYDEGYDSGYGGQSSGSGYGGNSGYGGSNGYGNDGYGSSNGYGGDSYSASYPTDYTDKYGDKYTSKYGKKYDESWKKPWKQWRPKTHKPDFFSLRVDQAACPDPANPTPDCQLAGFAARLVRGRVILTPYNKWWDDKLPIFFVDDDTQCYAVSKKPLQLYVDSVDGKLKYAKVGHLPANSLSLSFFKTGENPNGYVDPSPAYFSWPTTQGFAVAAAGGADVENVGPWYFCPTAAYTGQYEVLIANGNFGQAAADAADLPANCIVGSLAAINANPWRSIF